VSIDAVAQLHDRRFAVLRRTTATGSRCSWSTTIVCGGWCVAIRVEHLRSSSVSNSMPVNTKPRVRSTGKLKRRTSPPMDAVLRRSWYVPASPMPASRGSERPAQGRLWVASGYSAHTGVRPVHVAQRSLRSNVGDAPLNWLSEDTDARQVAATRRRTSCFRWADVRSGGNSCLTERKYLTSGGFHRHRVPRGPRWDGRPAPSWSRCPWL